MLQLRPRCRVSQKTGSIGFFLCQHMLQASRHNFQRNVMFWGACRVVFSLKLEAKIALKHFKPKSGKSFRNYTKCVACKCFLMSLLVSAGLAWLPWVRFGRHFWNWWSFFSDFLQKVCFCRFAGVLERKCCICRSGQPSGRHWGSKVVP